MPASTSSAPSSASPRRARSSSRSADESTNVHRGHVEHDGARRPRGRSGCGRRAPALRQVELALDPRRPRRQARGRAHAYGPVAGFPARRPLLSPSARRAHRSDPGDGDSHLSRSRRTSRHGSCRVAGPGTAALPASLGYEKRICLDTSSHRSEAGARLDHGASSRRRTAQRARAGTRSDIRLTLPARPENVAVVRHVLGALAEALALPARVTEDMRLAVTEACTNVVRHAYDDGDGHDRRRRATRGRARSR